MGKDLKKIPVRGGPPVRICQLPSPNYFGGIWSPDGGLIVFDSSSRLYEVPARGGVPTVLVSPEESVPSARGPLAEVGWPHFLPSTTGARILVFAFGSVTQHTMMIQDLATGRRELLGIGALPFYSPSGHVLYQSSCFLTADLWALPFLSTR